MEPVKKSGALSEISCPRLLAHLHRTRFDGTLRISRGALLKLLYFQAGEIAMASSNDQGDHLAPILIRAGKLKPEQMELARKSTKPGTSLARILVQMGFLTSGELFAGARQQLRQIVGSVLGMTDASYEIQGGFFPREITSLNVDTREMFLDLVRDLSDRSFVLLEVGSPDTIYVPVKDSENGSEALRLPRTWKDHAERFSSPLAIHEFGQMASLDDFSASKVVYGLSLFGCVAPQRNETSAVEPVVKEITVEPAWHAEPVPAAEPAGEETPGPTAQESSQEPSSDAEEPPGEGAVESIPTFRERFHSDRSPEVPDLPTAEPAAPPFSKSRASREEFHDLPDEAPSSFPGVDRVADGKPIRLEFKGPFADKLPPVRPSRPWAAASIVGGICLLALTSYWFIFLRVPESAPIEAPSAPASPAQAVESSADATSGDSPATGTVEGGDTTAPAATPAGETVLPDQQEQAPSQPSDASSAPAEAPEQVTPPQADTGAPVQGPAAPGATAPPVPAGFRASRARLDAGEYASAAQSWAKAFRAQAAALFTIQIAIACQEQTLKKAARRTPDSEQFFVLPFTLGDRPCYRLCWGLYESLDSAQSSRSTVPSFFLDEGGQPVVVSLRKALASEGR